MLGRCGLGGARGSGFPSLLRRGGAAYPDPDRTARADRRTQHIAAGRARRLGLHQPLEFPAGHLHRADRGGADQQGRGHRAADRRDRWHQRDAGGQHGPDRTGGRFGAAECVSQRRSALFGAAPAVCARRHCRRGDRDDPGCIQRTARGRQRRFRHRPWPGDRCRGLRRHHPPPAAPAHTGQALDARRSGSRAGQSDATADVRGGRDLAGETRNLRPGVAGAALGR